MMEKQEEQRVKDKVNYFYNEKSRVHVTRFDKTFWRGVIIDKRSEDVFEFIEDKLGKCLLFVTDIHDINLFREKE